jgi:hypothetical protein
MTWIRTTPFEQAEGELRQRYERTYALYPAEYRDSVQSLVDPATGTADSVTAAHSLFPVAMEHALSTFGVLLSPDLPLTRRQHEMIATVVSALNSCFY